MFFPILLPLDLVCSSFPISPRFCSFLLTVIFFYFSHCIISIILPSHELSFSSTVESLCDSNNFRYVFQLQNCYLVVFMISVSLLLFSDEPLSAGLCSISINWVSFSVWNTVRMAVSKTMRSLTLEPFLRLFWSPASFLFMGHTFCFFARLAGDWTLERTYALNAGLRCYLDSEPLLQGFLCRRLLACLVSDVAGTLQWCLFPTQCAPLTFPLSGRSVLLERECVYKVCLLSSLSVGLSAWWYHTSCYAPLIFN